MSTRARKRRHLMHAHPEHGMTSKKFLDAHIAVGVAQGKLEAELERCAAIRNNLLQNPKLHLKQFGKQEFSSRTLKQNWFICVSGITRRSGLSSDYPLNAVSLRVTPAYNSNMTTPFTPEIHAAIQLQAEFLILGIQMGLTEEKAREFAEEAIHKLMVSKVVHPNTKIAYERLSK